MIFPCPLFSHLVDVFKECKSEDQVYNDLSKIVNTITGQKLIKNIQFSAILKPAETCLTRFYLRGFQQAIRIRPFINAEQDVLEYGGGIGRLSCALVENCKSLTIAEVNSSMLQYGSAICPNISFKLIDQINDAFDFIYSVAVFFHLNNSQQAEAIKWVYDHLKPGGTFLLDLNLTQGKTKEPDCAKGEVIGMVNDREFYNSLSPYFEIKRIELFNVGLLLTKKKRK